jgi:hypothetical protein
MSTEITLTNGERIAVRATVQELEAAIDTGQKVLEFVRVDTGAWVFVVASQIQSFTKAEDLVGQDRQYFAFRGTLTPVNKANGEPVVAVLVTSAPSLEAARRRVERDQSSRGHRFTRVTDEAGPFKSAELAYRAAEGKANLLVETQ